MGLENRSNVVATLVAAAWLAFAPAGCKKEGCSGTEGRRKSAAEYVMDDFDQRISEAARVDIADGGDDLGIPKLIAKNKAFLLKLERENPQAHQIFIIKLKEILKVHKKKLEDDDDIEAELGVLDLEKLYELFARRDASVTADGTVNFPTPELEQRTSLEDLTPDQEFQFEAKSPKTLQKMGIKVEGAVPIFKVTKDTPAKVGGKMVTVKAGTFVMKVQTSPSGQAGSEPTYELYKVFVFSGDRIIDSISGGYEGLSQASAQKAPEAFETFLKVKMPDFQLPQARGIFHQNFGQYEGLLKKEYRELLVKEGVPIDKHFVYYLQWAQSNKIPISETSMRAFFDMLLKKRSDPSASKTPDPNDEIAQKANDSLEGKPDQDENTLSYQDQRSRQRSEQAEVALRAHGPLFALIRVQGSFTDEYTYNRLSGNYTAKVSATVMDRAEYIYIQDITAGLNTKSPRDILKVAKQNPFGERINRTTTYNQSSDQAFREALAFSESKIGGSNATPNDFQVVYAENGSVQTVLFKGNSYNPSAFIAPPEALNPGNVQNNQTRMNVGGIDMTFDLNEYFDHYRSLEKQNAGMSQRILVYDKQQKIVTRSRNPLWFVEQGGDFYRQIGEIITRGVKSPHQKLLAIGTWLQTRLDYIPEELAEINKTTYGTFMDRGGDCEDSFTAYKTLANAIGLGSYVGAVFFDGHVATIIKGNLGPTTYNIDGEVWTIVETATGEGQTASPGVTPNKHPNFFILPNGKMIPADGSTKIPLKIVPESSIDQQLVKNFNQALHDLEAFMIAPENQPNNQNLDRGVNIAEAGNIPMEKVAATHQAIAENGQMAESISTKFIETIGKFSEFLQKWVEFQDKQASAERRDELRGQPEAVSQSYDKYQKASRAFTQNAQKITQELLGLIESYSGRERDQAAMMELKGKIENILNRPLEGNGFIVIEGQRLPYSIIVVTDIMKHEYHETLKHLSPRVEGAVRKDLEAKIQYLNELIYGPYNTVMEILRANSGN